MKKLIKALVFVLIVYLFLCALTFNAYAGTSNVIDNAELLSSYEENMLQERIDKYKDASIIILTIDDARGFTSKQYAEHYYESQLTQDDGVILLIDMDNREIYIATTGTYEYKLQGRIDAMLDKAYDNVNNSDYYQAFDSMLDYVDNYSGSVISIQILKPTPESIFFSVLVVIIVAVILITKHNAANKKPKASVYLAKHDGFVVDEHDTVFCGQRDEVIRNYYKSNTSSGSRSGGSRSSGSSRSFGGGGRRF